jgi:serine kinase of HPr protein (carbohydrate metabolism regulator)
MICAGEEVVPMFVQATCVAIDGRGVLIRGRPGAGKSDLALRLIDEGASLVSDDGVELYAEGGAVYARFPIQAPPDLRGKIEVRGLGIAEVGAGPPARLALLVDLAAAETIERLPEKTTEVLMGIELFQVFVDPAEASAPAKVRLAVRLAARIIPPP